MISLYILAIILSIITYFAYKANKEAENHKKKIMMANLVSKK